MQVYYFEPNDDIYVATSREMAEVGIEAIRVEEDFFDMDLAMLGQDGHETRAVLISHDDKNSERTFRFIKSVRAGKKRNANPLFIVRDFKSSNSTADILNAGADDVFSRPFKGVEVAARINSVNRRTHGHVSPSVTVGDIVAYLDGRDPEVHGERMELTGREHSIFNYLALNAGRVITKDALYESVYGMKDTPPYDKVIDVYICKLRKKIRERTGNTYIETVYGRGYMFQAPDTGEEAPSVSDVAANIEQGQQAASFVGR
ncbi:response regulator transcription factor [Salipiger mucosus]|uniref:Two-component transcriptional regulator n=1 Tax=Salipiger mucosus DSM 16094 TaxID=1123237 RepID=S9Q9I3_9RHOB|nr:response regulator transcription factor [Salipiger mucosus]EPX78026.1 two-component transcriptional regulator [Salipiger mucosus DSM 16094]